MFRLRVFGGMSLECDGRAINPGLGRKPLALLVLAAAAGELGLSRDKVVGYLWPDSDAEHARNALSQTIYALRRHLGVAPLTGGVDLRLDTRHVASDLADFEAAMRASRFDDANALYAGVFLDGVFVDDAPDFERWVEVQRDRLAREWTRAVEAIARDAAAHNDWRRAADGWRRIIAADPASTSAVLELMRSLAANGDSAAAVEAARAHERILAAEFGASAVPEVRELAAELLRRSAAATAPATTRKRRRSGNDVASLGRVAPDPEPARPRRLGVAAAILIGLGIIATPLAVRAHRHVTTTAGRPRAWVDIDNLPTPIINAAYAVMGGQIHIAGGAPSGAGGLTSATYAYDAARQRWIQRPDLPSVHNETGARQWLATNSAVVRNRWYVAGGNIPGHCTEVTSVFDWDDERWHSAPPLPIELCHGATVAVQGRIYVLGGTNEGGNLPNTAVFVLTPDSGGWRVDNRSMPAGRTNMAAAVVGSTIYLFGGSIEASPCASSVLAYDTNRRSWSYRAPMTAARCLATAVALAGRIYVLGGIDTSPGAATCATPNCRVAAQRVFNSVDVYDPATNQWSAEAPLPVAAFGMAAGAVDGEIYALGGFDGRTAQTKVYKLTGGRR